jgi:hypothetical protein
MWLMDSGCSCHMTGSNKWFSSLDPMIGKAYTTFGDKSRGKVVSRGSVRVNESFVFKDVDLVSNFHNSMRMTMKCALKRAFLEFWMLKGILFVAFPLLVEFFKLILHTLLALLDVS